MLVNYLQHFALAATFMPFANAQASIPEDLATAFGAATGTELQVSFTGDAVDGFDDGAKFTTAQVTKAPTFALGDASAIVPAARYTVILVDTTSDTSRTLHFAQTNFALTGSIVNIASETTPVLAYQAPGAFGEKGARKYSFLLYQHLANKQLDTLKVPAKGQTLDVKQFETDNGFQAPVGGVGMSVDVAGGGGGQSAASSVAASSVAASSTAAEVVPSSAAVVVSSSAEVVVSSSTIVAVPSTSVRATSAAVTRASSVAIESSALSRSVANATTANAPKATSATPKTTDLAAASSITQSVPVLATSTRRSGSNSTISATRTPTDTGGAAQQSSSGDSGVSPGTAGYAAGAAMVVFAGLLGL